MGKIHVLPEHVANQIAAGEVVERPASVLKELLENALDAGATRIRVATEGGGRKLIQVIDNGCGMNTDDALLAFERHATSKLHTADDLLAISTLGFRGEALPSIAAVARLRLETRAAEQAGGTVVEIAGGRILKVEEAGLPVGTAITVRDLFFNTPARKKFLRSESTELSHIAALVTHYALAHPEKHFELHAATNAMLVAAPVASHGERIFQIFGKEMGKELLPVAAQLDLERSGLPSLSPNARRAGTPGQPRQAAYEDDDEAAPSRHPGEFRLHGFISKPEVQKLNRNSIFVFVNHRLIRDRLVQHALMEAYRNMMPPTVFPVVLLFLELPFGEVDVNVHPSKTEVRFRQQTLVHDFVRDSVRAALIKARPIPQFTREIGAHATARSSFTPPVSPPPSDLDLSLGVSAADAEFALRPPATAPTEQRLSFQGTPIELEGNGALAAARFPRQNFAGVGDVAHPLPGCTCFSESVAGSMSSSSLEDENAPANLWGEGAGIPSRDELASLKPLGQVQNSFIVATTGDTLWIIDQHVAHERVLFERVLRQRARNAVESQQLLMPLIVELTPGQQPVFAEIGEELRRNGFEVEPFGSRTVAVKTAPAGVEAAEVERMLHELLEQFQREEQAVNLEALGREIAASIACHAAIKVNTPLGPDKMEWLLQQLAGTECPISCPHGRPVVLRYSIKDIQRAFKRI